MVKPKPKEEEKPTKTEEELKQSLPADLRDLPPEEVIARQSLLGGQTKAPVQSIPPPGFPTIKELQAQLVIPPDVSAISGEALKINRINKFFLPKGEVTEQEFRRAKEEAKIISEGGRRGLPTEEQLRQFEGQQPAEPFTPAQQASEVRGQGLDVVGSLPEGAPARVFSEGAAAQVQAESQQILKLAAIAFDSIRTAISRKKPLTQAQAEETFNNLLTSIKADLQDIQLGTQDPSATRIKLVQMRGAIERYESFQKEFGNLNLNYWTDKGASIETDLLIMKETLRELEGDVALAKRQWLIRQFQAQPTFGT